MGIYLGSQPATLYLNGTEAAVAGVYLGGLQVFPTGPSVPGAPVIAFALFASVDTVIEWTAPASDGGSAIFAYDEGGYKVYVDGVLRTDAVFTNGVALQAAISEDLTGSEVEVSAVNSVGEGPKSDPVTVETV